MPFRNDDPETARFIRLAEAVNMITGALMVVLVVGCALLLDRNHRQMVVLELQLIERNRQGQQAVSLLGAAVDRLDRLDQLQPPLQLRSESAPPPRR